MCHTCLTVSVFCPSVCLAAPFCPVETKLTDAPTGNAADNLGVDTFLQLFIEFMQLLSIFRLTRISVVWRSAAEAVLLAMSITPISSYSWVSLECALREGLAPQQYALGSTLASTFVPGATHMRPCRPQLPQAVVSCPPTACSKGSARCVGFSC